MTRWLVFFLAGCGTEVARVEIERAAPDALVASATVVVLDQRDRDGVLLSCADFMSDALSPFDQRVRALKAPLVFDVGTPVDLQGIPPGIRDRVLYVEVFDGTQGRGRRVGRGCTDSVTFSAGRRLDVEIAW